MPDDYQSDEQLLTAMSNGLGGDAFARVVERHRNLVWRVAYRVLRDAEDADDVTQDVFSTLARRAESFTFKAPLASWLYRTTWHVALRKRRNAQTRQRHEEGAARYARAVARDVPVD